MPSFSQKVPDDFSGTERIDKYIASLPNGFNRSKLKSGIQEIFVNGNKSKLSGKIRAGDQIEIQWEDNVPDNIEPENSPLRIIFENDDVCVVNKEQGMVTHPAAGNWNGTLLNALLFHFGMDAIKQTKEGSEQEIQECRRPGIVHRLDKDTSGVIITAKHRDAEEYLSQEFKRICFDRARLSSKARRRNRHAHRTRRRGQKTLQSRGRKRGEKFAFWRGRGTL